MADNDRDEVERTTIVETGGGGGGGGVLAVVLLIIVVLVLLFLFRDQLGFGGDKTEVDGPRQDRRQRQLGLTTRTRGRRVPRAAGAVSNRGCARLNLSAAGSNAARMQGPICAT